MVFIVNFISVSLNNFVINIIFLKLQHFSFLEIYFKYILITQYFFHPFKNNLLKRVFTESVHFQVRTNDSFYFSSVNKYGY